MHDDTGYEAHQARRALRLKDELEDLRRLLQTEEGRRVMARLVRRFGVFEAVRTHSPADAAFFEGRRHTGLEFVNLLQAADRTGATGVLALSFDDTL